MGRVGSGASWKWGELEVGQVGSGVSCKWGKLVVGRVGNEVNHLDTEFNISIDLSPQRHQKY